MEKIYLAGAARTPIGSFQGALSKVSAKDLGIAVVKASLERSGVPYEKVDEVIIGSVIQAGQGQNVSRQIALGVGLDWSVPAMTVNMVCGSGLRTVVDACRIIKANEADIIIAGGTESMSMAPYLLPDVRAGSRMGNITVIDGLIHDGLTCAIEAQHMGVTAENIAERFSITREMQDELAYFSHMKAVSAIKSGYFDAEIVPITIKGKKTSIVMHKDEHPRPSTSLEVLSRLRPAFKKDGTVTAGNSSGINDGAAAVAVLSERAVEKYSIKPTASIKAWAYAGVEPAIMGTGPIAAVRKLFEKTGMKLEDIDLIEANEAFAAQAIAVGKELGWYKTEFEDRVNISGGAIALGHPIGASGCRILTTLLYNLERKKMKTGLAALCIGGGMGIAMIVEREV